MDKPRIASLVLALIVMFTMPVSAAGIRLKPVAPETFFVTPEMDCELRWTIDSNEEPLPGEYVIRDYWQRDVKSGTAERTDDFLSLGIQLPAGFYDIEFPGFGQRFGIVSLPACSGTADPFFAIDSALSWLVHDDDTCFALAKVLQRSGVRMSRERFSWSQIQPQSDAWRWEETRYERIRRGYLDQGISVLEMCHDAPAWLGQVGKYPQDLVGAAKAWPQICRRWRSTWGGLEIWNEPDIFFGADLPGDQYAALVKTVAYATKQAERKVPLIGGVTAHFNADWLDSIAENQVLDRVDGFSFHTYGRAPAMEALAGRFREYLAVHQHGDMPLWLTECGRPWPRGTDRPTAEADQVSALDITMKAVEARCCGVARYFAFVFPFYEENDNNFGMMGRAATPLRSMAAYAYAASVLQHLDYLGDLDCRDQTVQRARVFGDQHQAVAVLYTGQPNSAAAVPLRLPVLKTTGIDGRPLAASDDGMVPIPDGISYVWLDRDLIAKHLIADTAAQQIAALAKSPPDAPPRRQSSPIVMRFDWDPNVWQAKSGGYWSPDALPDSVPLRVRTFNLSDDAKDLRVHVEFEANVPGTKHAQESLHVPAAGFVDHTWDVSLADVFARQGKVRLTWFASDEAGQSMSRLVVDLHGQATLERVLDLHPEAIRLPIQSLDRWQSSIAGHGRMTMESVDGGWKMQATFTGEDRWVYPQFRLPETVDVTKVEGMVLRGRCAKPGLVRVFLWEGDRGVGYLTTRTLIPGDGRWHTATIRPTDFSLSGANAPDPNGRLDLDQVQRISIGMNSEALENELEISDLYLLTKEP